MVRCVGRSRHPWEALASACVALALVACGGGGSTPTGGGDTGGTGAGAESAYLLAEFVAGDTNNQYVRVWDPAHPDVAIQNVRLVESNGIVWTASHLVFSDATQMDAATHTVRTLGHAKVFYDNDGRVYSIDLRGGRAHAPVQLSSAVDVQNMVGAFPLGADGADAWVDATGGAHDWAVRTSMAATDAPVSVLRISAAMRDATTGAPQFLFASLGGQSGTHVDPKTFEVVDTNFQPLVVPAVAAMVGGDGWLGADPAQPGLAYLKIGGQVRALRWSGAAVSVDAGSVHDYAFGDLSPAAVADASALYFLDGTTLLGLADAAVQVVGTYSTVPQSLVDLGDHVAAVEALPQGADCCRQIETLDKVLGTRALVASGAAGLDAIGASDRLLVLVGTVEGGSSAVLVNADNTVHATVPGQFIGLVRSATARLDQPAASLASLSCTADAASGLCGTGPLVQLDIATLAATPIGSLAVGPVYVYGDLVAGLPGSLPGQTFAKVTTGFGNNETDNRDAWQFTPGVPGSLQRVTTNLH